MEIEALLIELFNYQKFEKNKSLEQVICLAKKAFPIAKELNEKEVDIWAAGDPQKNFYNPLEDKND